MEFCIVISTTSNLEEAKKIAVALVEKKLAACVNIVPKICSIYAWENKVCEDEEYLMLIKTDRKNFEQIKNLIKIDNSYAVPEVISVGIKDLEENYLGWLTKNIE